MRVVVRFESDHRLLEIEADREAVGKRRRHIAKQTNLGIDDPTPNVKSAPADHDLLRVVGHVGGDPKTETIASRRHDRRQLDPHDRVPLVLRRGELAAVAPLALLGGVLERFLHSRPLELPAGDLLRNSPLGLIGGRQLTREHDRVRGANLDDFSRVVLVDRVPRRRMGLRVVSHVEDFRELLAARIAGDALRRIDVELRHVWESAMARRRGRKDGLRDYRLPRDLDQERRRGGGHRCPALSLITPHPFPGALSLRRSTSLDSIGVAKRSQYWSW